MRTRNDQRAQRQQGAAVRGSARAERGDAEQLRSLVDAGHGDGREAQRLKRRLVEEAAAQRTADDH